MSAIPQITIHQLPTAPGAAQSSDYLVIDRPIGNGSYISYKIAVSQIAVGSFSFSSTTFAGSTSSLADAVSKALSPVGTTSTVSSGTYQICGTGWYGLSNIQLTGSTATITLPTVPSGSWSSSPQNPILVQFFGQNSGGTTVTLPSSGIFWASGAPVGNTFTISNNSTVLMSLRYMGTVPNGFSAWIGMLYGTPSSGSSGLSGVGNPNTNSTYGIAGQTYVDTSSGGFYWCKVTGTGNWLP